MEFAAVLNELEQKYGLKENETAILRLLIDSQKKLDAREISKRTKVPMGRIYDFLNGLLTQKLIEKTGGVPAKYYVGEFGQRVQDFLDYQLELEKDKHLALAATLEKESVLMSMGIRILHTKDEFLLELIRQAELGGRFKVLLLGLSIPFVLYPETHDEFLKMRDTVRKNVGTLTGKTSHLHFLLNDALNRKHHAKKKTEFAISAKSINVFINSLIDNYGKNFAKKYLLEIKKKLIDCDAHIHTLKESFPYYISISEKNIIFATHSGNEIISVIFEGNESVQIMSRFFDLLYDEGRDINEVFGEHLKKSDNAQQ